MKQDASLRTQLIGSCLSLILILVFLVLAVTTFCWFSKSEAVRANGMSVRVDASLGLSARNVRIFKRDGAQGAREVTDADAITLTEYDTIFTDKNVNTPLILRVEVTGLSETDGAYPTLSLEASWDTGMAWKNDAGALTETLSNIIDFRFIVADAALADPPTT